MSESHSQQKTRYLQHLEEDSNSGTPGGAGHALETTPIFSLAVRHAGSAGSKGAISVSGEKTTKAADITGIRHPNRNDTPSEDKSNSSSNDNSDSSSEDSSDGSSDLQIVQPTTNNQDVLSQYGLLGFHVGDHPSIDLHEPIFLNTRAPNSTFLCGSQGSGKSFTLSCILENCLLPNPTFGSVKNPVAGVAFHYDDDDILSGAEVASLRSRGIEVNVLVPASNYHKLNAAYQKLARDVGGQVNVERLLLQDKDLTIGRLHKLMSFNESSDNGVPLYVAIINNTLLQMATEGRDFTLSELERRLDQEQWMPTQRNLLDMRFKLLKSYLASGTDKKYGLKRNIFQTTPGSLTIVDLGDPFIDTSMVCTLFDMCLGLFKENRPKDGLIITLDEAHKYLNNSTGAEKFTEHLITTVRMQRHHASRVIIATQEPTISGSLLDLCSVSIVHRFTSPAWFQALKEHLSAASSLIASGAEQKAMFESIVNLRVGESFVFSPSSFVCMDDGKEKKLGTGILKMKTRKRTGHDLGKSKMAGENLNAEETGGNVATGAFGFSTGGVKKGQRIVLPARSKQNRLSSQITGSR